MGLRLLVLLILILLVVWLVRRLWTRPPSSRRVVEADMLRCAHCGLHVPADEAIRDGELAYCCDAHRQAGPRK